MVAHYNSIFFSNISTYLSSVFVRLRKTKNQNNIYDVKIVNVLSSPGCTRALVSRILSSHTDQKTFFDIILLTII